jgi:hypothetical protein
VTIDGVLDWILDLLTTYTHDSELQAVTVAIANLHNSQITTAPPKSFAACYVFNSRSLATASIVEILQLHAFKSSPSGGSLPTTCFPHRLPYRTDKVAPIIFLCADRVENTVSNSTSIVAYVSIAAGTCLPSRCLGTNVVSEQLLAKSCFSGFVVLALNKYAAIQNLVRC